MIRVIDGLPDNVVGIVAKGRVTAADCDKVLKPVMQTSLKQDPTTGVFSFDRPTFEQGLIQGGMGHLYPTLAETLFTEEPPKDDPRATRPETPVARARTTSPTGASRNHGV